MAEMLSGGDMLIRALQDEGVEYIFGYPEVLPCTSMTQFSVSRKLNIYWCATNRRRLIWLMATRGQPATPASCS